MAIGTNPDRFYAPTSRRAPGVAVSPLPDHNEQDHVGRQSRDALARQIYDEYKNGLTARRERDLISEKLLLHIDGSGDFQWADILNGTRVEIPRLISEFRKTENLLRLIVDNAVAHHTTMPLQYLVDSAPDRDAKDKATIDSVWINDLSYQQDFNNLFAEALYLAMPAGFCPVHAYWREDAPHDWHEPVTSGPDEMEPGPDLFQGMIDCWVGNPWATVFDMAATRGSVRWCAYERILPADLIREHFGHIPGVNELQGTTKLPSAAEFQRIARTWLTGGLAIHGNPVISERRSATYRGPDTDSDEVMAIVCRETAPFSDPRWPEGRLQIIAIPGAVDTRMGEGDGTYAMLLADQPLPGHDFSWTNFYSHHRGSDIHGKPWVEDIDQLQVDLNIARSKRWECVIRQMDAPIVVPGGAIDDDLADLDGYSLLEIEPSLAAWRPQVMQWPQSIMLGLDKEIAELRQAIYTGGGYQASSRGEAPGSRMAYRAIVALQQADNTVHGPVNMRFRRSSTDFAQKCHSQMRMYGDIPWLLSNIGDEHAHLAPQYIDNTQMSQRPPKYRLVNSFGTSPEMMAQEVLELVGMRGADGQPFLTTEEGRRKYPNQTLFNTSGDPSAVQKRRARAIAKGITDMAADYRKETGLEENDPAHPWVQQAGMQVFQMAERRFPRLRDDLLHDHLAALSEITQDETADTIARAAAMMRQDLYYQWQMQMAGIPVSGPGGASAGGTGAPVRDGMDPRSIAQEMGGSGQGATLDAVDGGAAATPIAATAR